MENVLMIVLEWILRAFGLFWVFGGYMAYREAKQSKMIDKVLGALEPERKPSTLLTNYLCLSTVLTPLSGLFIMFGSSWTWIPVGVLVLAQLIYFFIQSIRFQQAENAEERAEATVAQSTKNAMLLSVIVWIGTLTIF